MNKAQLVEAVSARIGDRRTAAAAVDGVLDTIVSTVGAGESVALTGFGVFEGRARAARTARNPRTGAAVEVPATTVPAFRPGATFRAAVSAAASATTPAAQPAELPVAAGAAPVRRSAAFTTAAVPDTVPGAATVAVTEKPAKKVKAKRAATADADSRKKPKKRKKVK